MKNIRLGKRMIGSGYPCFVIAEAGANHNRSLRKALRLIDVAAEAGADAVKFQTYSAETLYSKKTPQFTYLRKLEKSKSTYEILKENEIPRHWHSLLMTHAKKRGIMFLSTPFDQAAVDELDVAGVSAYKWASFEIVDLPLLRYAAKKKKPIILSTGMCNMREIRDAVTTIRSAGNNKIALLHCTSLYPTPLKDVNLRMMDTMREVFKMPVGLSDHTMGVVVPIGAVARGACIIEKHFTLSRKANGPDHPFALEPKELKQMVTEIRSIEIALGMRDKRMLYTEREMARLARRSIIARVDIRKGKKLSIEDIIIKRPGYGIEPKYIKRVIGRKARKTIKADDIITWHMVK